MDKLCPGYAAWQPCCWPVLLARRFQRRREFQILTPQAIASVRGTKWAMEVKPGETSTLVLA
jgi:hypothetical protein